MKTTKEQRDHFRATGNFTGALDASALLDDLDSALASAEAWKAKYENAEAGWADANKRWAHGVDCANEREDWLRDAIHQMRTTFKLNKHAQEWADFIEEHVNRSARPDEPKSEKL